MIWYELPNMNGHIVVDTSTKLDVTTSSYSYEITKIYYDDYKDSQGNYINVIANANNNPKIPTNKQTIPTTDYSLYYSSVGTYTTVMNPYLLKYFLDPSYIIPYLKGHEQEITDSSYCQFIAYVYVAQDPTGKTVDYYTKFYDSNFNLLFNVDPPINYVALFQTTYMPTMYDASCFNEGTKILCLNHDFNEDINHHFREEYIPIENLKKGDLVKTYKHGYREIDMIGKNIMINNPEHFNLSMYKMKKTDTNGLIEDLIVTGGHGILVDDLGDLEEKNRVLFQGVIPEIDDKKLLLAAVSKDFVQIKNVGLYTYYHLTLENDGNDDERYGIWSNGLLTETPSKKQFLEHKYIEL